MVEIRKNPVKRLEIVMKTLIKNGHLLNPATKKDGKYDILIKDGMIAQIKEQISEEADRIVNAQGKYVLPGFIDLHVHLREPGFEYKETIKTGTRAAARGGFTSVCPMPNTKPVMDSPERIQQFLEKVKTEACVHVLPVGAVTLGQSGDILADIEGMKRAGAVAISEDGKSVMNTKVYYQGMKLAGEAGIPVFAHCEDRDLVGKGVMNLGEKSKELGLEGISNAVEDVIIARDILMAKEVGVKLHLCHCSTKDSVALVKLGKELGHDVTAEVCPHHFAMSDKEIIEDDGRFKMNPPLRGREDVETLKEGLKNGIMEVIATDHAPHGEEEKAQSMNKAPFGIVGLETAFALTVTELVDKGYLTKMQLVEKMSTNPAKILGIDKGTIEEGKMADMVIVDFDEPYTIDKGKFASKGKNTPFDGKEVKGRVLMTLVDGTIIYEYEQMG